MKIEPRKTSGLNVPDTVSSVLDTISMYSLDVPAAPPEDERPRIPYNVSDLPGRSLGALLSRLTAYYEYISALHGLYDVLRENLKDSLDTATAEAFVNSKGSIEQKKNLAKIDPAVVDLRERYVEERSRARLIEKMVLKPLRKDISTVSRMIAVKDQEVRISNRDDNVGDTDMEDAFESFYS